MSRATRVVYERGGGGNWMPMFGTSLRIDLDGGQWAKVYDGEFVIAAINLGPGDRLYVDGYADTEDGDRIGAALDAAGTAKG